ncbi:MAG: ATP-dependent sacrificial sulfur transferase LarE [Deltaproteobacteria bacterium]|nr:ATP-dependent sacrificial sulfur transferase LarE [Deltaproteobacteria bacterium]
METSLQVLQNKYNNLISYLKKLESVAVGYSGGVDSTFLLAASVEALGDKAIGVVGISETHSEREKKDAIEFSRKIGARLIFTKTNELEKESFYTNPVSRCYTCKETLFKNVIEVAKKEGCLYILDGSNADDTGDYRPGINAAKELDVLSPLLELGFTKNEIRLLSKSMGLPSWDKPAFACLASRVPYGSVITSEKLSRIENSENDLFNMGFKQLRVRDYEELCRVEFLENDIPVVLEKERREAIVKSLKNRGYKFVTLDLEGFRTGSMNEILMFEK